jgi:hypothetical protein
MVEKNIICEFCGDKFGSKSGIYTHQRTIAKCLAIQMEKLGKLKYKPVKEDPSKKKAAKEKPANNKPVKQAEKPKEEVSDEDDVSENDEIPLESSSDDDDVEIKGMSSSEEETDKEDSDKEDAIKFFKGMGATKFDNIKTFKKKYSTSSREVINDDNNVKEEIKEQPVNNEINDRISKLDSKVGEMMTTIVKVGDSVKKLNDLVTQFITKNDKNIVNDITNKIEEIFGTTIENNVETSKKILAEIDSKNETLEIFKEDIEETCDKYYEIYKKFKSIKEDMEDMVGARSSRRK